MKNKREVYLYEDGIYGLVKDKNSEYLKKLFNITTKDYNNLKPFINTGRPAKDFQFVIDEKNLIPSWSAMSDMMNIVSNLFDKDNYDKQIIRVFGFVNQSTNEFKFIVPKQISSEKQQKQSTKMIEDEEINKELNDYLFSETNFKDWLYCGQFIFVNESDMTTNSSYEVAFSEMTQKVFIFEDFCHDFEFKKCLSAFIYDKNGNNKLLSASDVRNIVQLPIQQKKTDEENDFDNIIQQKEYEYIAGKFNFIDVNSSLLNYSVFNIVNEFDKNLTYPYLSSENANMKKIKIMFKNLQNDNQNGKQFNEIVYQTLDKQKQFLKELSEQIIFYDEDLEKSTQQIIETEDNLLLDDSFDSLINDVDLDNNDIKPLDEEIPIKEIKEESDLEVIDKKVPIENESNEPKMLDEEFETEGHFLEELSDDNELLDNDLSINELTDESNDFESQEISDSDLNNLSLDDLPINERFVKDQDGVDILFTPTQEERKKQKELEEEEEKDNDTMNALEMLMGDD